MSNSYGTIFRISTFGESHGTGVGVVIDGCPAGLGITIEEIQQALERRRPGQSSLTSPRQETDQVQILSGILKEKRWGRLLLCWFLIRMPKAKIIATFRMHFGHHTPILLTLPNMDIVIIGVEVEALPGKH